MEQELPDGTKVKRQRHPIPDGYVTPSQLVQHLGYYGFGPANGVEAANEDKVILQAASIYNWCNKEDSDFPAIVHTDNRTIIPREDGLNWIQAHYAEIQEKKRNRAATKARRGQRNIKSALIANRAFALAK